MTQRSSPPTADELARLMITKPHLFCCVRPECNRWTGRLQQLCGEHEREKRAKANYKRHRKEFGPRPRIVAYRDYTTRDLCVYCQQRPAATFDHITAASRGGRPTIENAAPSCAECNGAKGDRPLFVFLAETWRRQRRRFRINGRRVPR